MGFEDAFANMNKPKQQKNDKNQKQPQQVAQAKKEEPKPKKEKPKRANIGWLFYNDYFKGLDYMNIESEKNKLLINDKVANIIKQGFSRANQPQLGNATFELQTIYPGLLLGSGNAHELPSIEGQAILGFHFDYTSGLPEIAGSSIKGVLRSAFAHESYIKEILKDEEVEVKKLESEIFDNGDVFFDAFIAKSGKENKILGDDFITPHKEATKNPIPLRFLKVIPEVSFIFYFELKDGLITKEQKIELFKSIILDFGLGAKTNVGYGKFQG